MPERMSDERLAAIESQLNALRPHADELGMRSITDDATDLLAEVRRLKAAIDGCRCGHGPSCPLWKGASQVAWKS